MRSGEVMSMRRAGPVTHRSIQKIWPAARYRRPDSGRLSELDPNTRRIARLEFVTGIELFRILVELEVILLDLAKQVGCVGVKSQIVVQIVGDVHVDRKSTRLNSSH